MRIAQQLYEAGLITYHRTDSTNMAKAAVNAARGYIQAEHGKEFVEAKPRFFKTKSKSAQEAHEAIRPTDVKQLKVEGVNAVPKTTGFCLFVTSTTLMNPSLICPKYNVSFCA